MKKNNAIIAGLAACVILSISPGDGRSAEPGGSISTADTVSVASADTSSVGDTETGKGHWIALPAFFYTPETGFGGGPAAGYIFPRIGDRPPSSIMGTFFYTEKKQTILKLASELYTGGGFHGISEVGYQKFPDSFWGIGPDTEEDDEEKYTPELFEVKLRGLVEIVPLLRAGIHVMYRREVMMETEEGGRLETRKIPGSEGGTTAGAGLIATYDSRDNIFSSSRGWYAEFSHGTYGGGSLTSDYGFTSLALDVRKFFPVTESHVFAARFFTHSTIGTAPFQDLPSLGGPCDMRGYRAGRYRDKFAAYVQAEYRFHVVWVVSMAFFGSMGNVSPAPADYDFGKMKYAGGGGLRFMLNEERYNVRIDAAANGDASSAFYISFNEAF